jgi:hypothetical protein
MKWRVLLFKTLSLLCFDDVLDDYRANIRNTIQLIKLTSPDELDRVLYDLTGICDGIDSETVYQYFLTKFLAENNYSQLMENMVKTLGGKESYLKDILHLTYLFVHDKQGDAKSSKLARLNYTILTYNLPFWNVVLGKYGLDEQKVELFEEIYLIHKTIIADGHINLALAD